MRYFTTVLLGVLLAGCSSSNTATPGSQNEYKQYALAEGTILHQKLLWQDQPINAKKKFAYNDAFEYCALLDFADVRGWRVPTLDEAEQLNAIAHKLKYKTKGYYHTTTGMCEYKIKKDPVELLFSPLTIVAQTLDKAERTLAREEGSCGYKITESGFETAQIRNGYVRCVIIADRYYAAQRKKEEKILALKQKADFESYLELYRLTHDISYIKSAYSKASTLKQKIEAEKLLAATMKEKIFDIVGGKNGTSKLTTQKATVLGVVSGASFTDKDFVKSFTVKSDFLEYGTYIVKIKFLLKKHYHAAVFGFGTSTTETDSKTMTFKLSPQNHFRQTKTVRFEREPASMQQSVGGMNAMSIKLVDAELTYELLEIK